jgi:hypothetical protein
MEPGVTTISIVIACYNAGEFIQETLHSIASQNYPDLELIVIDGASTDGTQEIIERYGDHISYYISDEDGGQYEAIQKGLSKAKGEVMAWLNADDIYMPWTLFTVGEIFATHPDVDWITGLPSFLSKRGQMTAIYGSPGSYPRTHIANGWFRGTLGGYLQQESMFWRRSLWDKTGGLDLSLRLAADFKLWTDFARHSDLVPVTVPLASFRKLPGQQRSSVGADRYEQEVEQVCEKLTPAPRLWSAIAARGVVFRSLCRLAIRHKAPAIIYDEAAGAWNKVTTRRPLSRVGLSNLRLQFALRERQGPRGAE